MTHAPQAGPRPPASPWTLTLETMMTMIESDLRYLAAEELLEQLLADLKAGKQTVPQPEDTLVADAYGDGRLDSHSTCLHVIACLLRRAKSAR